MNYTVQLVRPSFEFTAVPGREAYKYSSLTDALTNIRLLILASGSAQDPIHCNLVQVTLLGDRSQNGEHRWEALSYVWGDDGSETDMITVDGKSLAITTELRAALGYLRSASRPRVLWIDQICINQADDLEKGNQLALMKNIYAGAENVIAYLGRSSTHLEHLCSVLSQLKAETVDAYRARDDKGEGCDADKWSRILQTLRGHDHLVKNDPAIIENDHRLFEHFEALLHLDYFRRVWTLQEAVIGPSLLIQVGHSTMNADHIEEVLQMLRLANHSSLISVKTGGLSKPASIFELRRLYLQGRSSEVDSIVLLDSSKHRGATDDRDRVYGILSLLSTDPVATTANSDYQLCYRKSVETVYMEMTIALMEKDKTPEPFKFCCAKREGSKYSVPSWSEDWSLAVACGTQSNRSMYSRPRIFHAATLLPFHIEPLSEIGRLLIRGTEVGTLEAVVKSTDNSCTFGRTWTAWLDLRNRHHGAKLSLQEHLKSLCRTLVADCLLGSAKFQRAPASFIQQVAEWAHKVTENNIREKLTELSTYLPVVAAQITDTLRFFSLYITENGFLGKSCQHVDKGDTLCLIHGGKLPFVLRSTGTLEALFQHQKELWQSGGIFPSRKLTQLIQCYQVIGGESFVDGLADSQGLALADDLETTSTCSDQRTRMFCLI